MAIRHLLRAAACAALLASSGTAFAKMPTLTPMPSPPSSDMCFTWAVTQAPETLAIWGVRKEGGTPSRDLAGARLAAKCMGDEPAEIVGFGSDKAFDVAYCGKHPDHGICKTRDGKPGFVFGAAEVLSPLDPKLRIAIGDNAGKGKLGFALNGYSVRREPGDDCPTCVTVTGPAGTLFVIYGTPGITMVTSRDDKASDTLGNRFGGSLASAVGGKAVCRSENETVCESDLKGLSYIVAGDSKCDFEAGDGSKMVSVPACARIGGFQIMKAVAPPVAALKVPPATGFVFGADIATNALRPSESVRLGDKIGFAGLKRRFSTAKVVSQDGADCEKCSSIEGPAGSLVMSYSDKGVTAISSSDPKSSDVLGNRHGGSLRDAVGPVASCEAGMEYTCDSTKLKGLVYSVDMQDSCPFAVPDVAKPVEIPACAKIGGFQTFRYPNGFVFGTDTVTDPVDPKATVRLGEKIGLAGLKLRFANYNFSVPDDCKSCALVSGPAGTVKIDLDKDVVMQISGTDPRSADAAGNGVGSKLVAAVGQRATCMSMAESLCDAPKRSGMSYIVADDDKCRFVIPDLPKPVAVPACATIGGFFLRKMR